MIILHDDNTEYFKIQLREDLFVNKWLNHLRHVCNTYNKRAIYATIPLPIKVYYSAGGHDKKSVIELVDKLHDTIRNINGLINDFPLTINDLSYDNFLVNDLSTQKLLNELHHYFTNADKILTKNPTSLKLQYSDSLDVARREYKKLIQDINQTVHKLDNTTITPRVQYANEHNEAIDVLQIKFDFYGSTVVSLKEDCFKWLEKEDMLSASDSEEYDVWMGVDLLGKDYITGYYHHENPTEWDITTVNCYTGQMDIVLGENNIPGLVKSEHFQDWLKEYNIKYTPIMCGIPLGKVISRASIDKNSIERSMKKFQITIER